MEYLRFFVFVLIGIAFGVILKRLFGRWLAAKSGVNAIDPAEFSIDPGDLKPRWFLNKGFESIEVTQDPAYTDRIIKLSEYPKWRHLVPMEPITLRPLEVIRLQHHMVIYTSKSGAGIPGEFIFDRKSVAAARKRAIVERSAAV